MSDVKAAAEAACAKVDELRAQFKADPTNDDIGRALLAARDAASDALAARWAEHPDEKPKTKVISSGKRK